MARVGMELERAWVDRRGLRPGDRRLRSHDIENADPPGPTLDDFATTRAADGYVIGDDRGDPNAVEFHRGRIVAGRRHEGVNHRYMADYEDDLPPSEAAREKRRDRDADAQARAGMKTGLAKQFKQVLDTQVKRAGRGSAGQAPKPTERMTGDDPGQSERAGELRQAQHRKP